MTIDMDYYRKINGLYGTTDKKDYLLKQAIKSVNMTNDNILSTFEILINSNSAEDIIADGISRKCIFDYSKNSQDTKTEFATYTREMWIEANIINVGSIIKYTDKVSLLENTYIVISKEEDLRGFDLCYIQKSNNTLHFYPTLSNESSVLNELLSVPCIIGKGSIGLDTNKYLSLPADEYIITCPNNLSSKKITENTRFILSGSAYKIEGIDDISMLGLLNIRVKQDQISEDDNLDLGIANYYSHQSIKEIYILNGTSASLLYTNATLQLNILAKENGLIVENPTVTYSSSHDNVAVVSETGLITAIGTGDAVVTVTYGNVSSSINIHSDMIVEDNYNIVISPTDTTLKLSRSITLTAHSMKNGVEDFTKQFVWSLSNLDGSFGNYATIVVDGENCTVTANSLSSVANKYIVVRCSLTSDNTIITERQIKLINLF